jgi:hypothetical protein
MFLFVFSTGNKERIKMKKLIVILLFFALVSPLRADSEAEKQHYHQVVTQKILQFEAQAKVDIKTYDDWCNSPFVQNDKVYATIRRTIDSDIASHKQTPHQIFLKYGEARAQNPKNLEYLFGYIYAAVQKVNIDGMTASPQEYKAYPDLYDIISSKTMNVPHTYNWARLSFIAHSFNGSFPGQISVGERILSKDPNDDLMKYCLASVLSDSFKPEERLKAIDIAQKQLALHHDATAYISLANVYFEVAFRSHDPKYADLAINTYGTVIQQSPKQYQKDYYNNRIKYLEQEKQQWASNRK